MSTNKEVRRDHWTRRLTCGCVVRETHVYSPYGQAVRLMSRDPGKHCRKRHEAIDEFIRQQHRTPVCRR